MTTERQFEDDKYRDKLVEWMASMDIPTGADCNTFADCLEVVAAYLTALRRAREE